MAAKIKELVTMLANDLAVTWGDGSIETVIGKQFTTYADDRRPTIPVCANSVDFETQFIKLEYTVGTNRNTIRLFVEVLEDGCLALKYTLNSTNWEERGYMPTMDSNRRSNTNNVCLFICGDSLYDTDSGGLWIIGDVDTGIYTGGD